MNLNIKDLITLEDDCEYLVNSIAYCDDYEYVYLIDINNNENVKFCKIINSNDASCLEEITDDRVIAKIAPLLYDAITAEVLS